MVNFYEVAQMIEEQLNGLAENVKFKIFANNGEYENFKRDEKTRNLPKSLLNGMMLQTPGSITPVKNLNNFLIAFSLDIATPREYVPEAQAIMNAFIEQNIGETWTFGDYVATINFDTPFVGEYEIRGMVGQSLPLRTNIYFQFIKNGILSNDCKVFIDGEEILYTDFAIIRARIAESENLLNDQEMRSVIQQQGLSFEMIVPYTKSTVLQKIMNDITGGSLTQTYTLDYADGYADTKTWVVVLQDGKSNYQVGKIPSLMLTFLLARTDITGV